MRLTVHVEDAPFIDKERKLIGKDLQGKDMFKPKRSKCIVNTFSYKGLKDMKEVEKTLIKVKSKYTIAKYNDKQQHTFQNGKEMIYVSFCNR